MGFLLSIFGILLFLSLETLLRLLNDDRMGQPVVNCDKDHGHNKRSQGMTNVLNYIDCVHSNVQFSHHEALWYVFEDKEAVIKMIMKGRSPTMRHVS